MHSFDRLSQKPEEIWIKDNPRFPQSQQSTTTYIKILYYFSETRTWVRKIRRKK